MKAFLRALVIAASALFCPLHAAQDLGNGRWFWVGSDKNERFSDARLEYLVETASTIVLAQAYAGFDIEAHHDVTRRAKALDPGVHVYGYMSGTYVKPRFEWMAGVKDEWILHDEKGEPIVHKFRDNGLVGAYFADLSNPEYRAFLVHVARQWMETAPYDGIVLDACNFVHGGVRRTFMDHEPDHERARTPFKKLLKQEKMDAVNAGLEDLFREVKAAIGEDRYVVWNGFWRKKHTIDRSLALVPLGDVSLSERWGTTHLADPRAKEHSLVSREDVLEDLAIVTQGLAAGKCFLPADTVDEKWYSRAPRHAIEHAARFSWGTYMLVHEPSRTAYCFSAGPRFSQNFHTDPVLLDPISFGAPKGGFRDDGKVLWREFERGVVYVNATDSPATVTVPRDLVLLHGEGVPDEVARGEKITIRARDAVILRSH